MHRYFSQIALSELLGQVPKARELSVETNSSFPASGNAELRRAAAAATVERADGEDSGSRTLLDWKRQAANRIEVQVPPGVDWEKELSSFSSQQPSRAAALAAEVNAFREDRITSAPVDPLELLELLEWKIPRVELREERGESRLRAVMGVKRRRAEDQGQDQGESRSVGRTTGPALPSEESAEARPSLSRTDAPIVDYESDSGEG
ncbi:unnamed protein product [Polarella glacialis]|uniref:Uncharacterized protein n=1 Tax=Polarella glacialis TaxID=89957 RepID=A0A813JCX8_POLGL|nr:unnamed protein product [Polarella glacialis]CAE8671437.1 unnamed protein product [Polarella glacialis]